MKLFALLFLSCLPAAAQNYSGPRPPKPDLPYLKHAENLVPTEATEAKEEKGKKDDIIYVVAGPESAAKTPLASPIFLLQAAKLAPDRLQLFKLESKNGRREIVFAPKKQPKPIRMEVTKISSDRLYRIEVSDSLDIPGRPDACGARV